MLGKSIDKVTLFIRQSDPTKWLCRQTVSVQSIATMVSVNTVREWPQVKFRAVAISSTSIRQTMDCIPQLLTA